MKFNLTQLIVTYNINNKNNVIRQNKTWGLVYLSEEGLAVLDSIAQLIDAIRIKQTKRTSLTSLKNLSHCYQLISILKNKQTSNGFYQHAKKASKQVLTYAVISKIDEWEAKQAQWLDNEKNWDYLIDLHPEAKDSLVQLKTFWDKQSVFAYASNDFLLLALEKLKKPLEELAQAELEFKNKYQKLPVFIADQYAQYLNVLRAILDQIKQQLLNTMCCRLYVAGKSYSVIGHLYKDDVLVYIVEELQRLGVVNKEMQIRGYWQTLQPYHFNRFHEAIQHDGSQKLQQELLQLPWFKNGTKNLETKNVTIDDRSYIIPTALEEEFSNIGSWRARVLRNRKHSIKFVREHQATFAALKLGYPDVTPFEVAERFQRLDQYEQVVKDASKKVAKLKPSFWQIWSYFGYRQLISKWQELVTEKAEFCLNERIRLLEQMVEGELAPKDKDNRYELWLQVRQQLAQLIPHRQHELTERTHNRLLTVEISLKLHLEQDPEQFAKCLIRALANNQELKEDELKYILDFAEIKELSPDKHAWFGEIAAYRVKASQALLLQTRVACNDQETCVTSPFVINNLTLAYRLTGEDGKQYIYQTVKKIVLQQGRWLLKEEPEIARHRLSSLQTLVYQFGNQNLKTWMNELPSDISDSNWKQFLSICQSNLMLLETPSKQNAGTSASVATTTNAKALEQKPFFLSWRIFGSPSISRLSTSAPTTPTKEPVAASLLYRSFY